MNNRVINRLIGAFLQVFGALLLLPAVVGLYYDESLIYLFGYVVAAGTSIVLGTGLRYFGSSDSPTVSEALLSTVMGWVLAVILGSIPFLARGNFTLYSAIFESAAGLTTTGISLVANPSSLSESLLFWRSFMQWIGGLGILTFFIAVIRESGGASRRLFSAEAHKTDSGSIRPSLLKSIGSLWKVYGFMTSLIIATFLFFGAPVFESLLHGFSTISTGGFSTIDRSIGGFESTGLEISTTVFMFIGGVNFVLLYRFLRSEISALLKSSEFRTYLGMFSLFAAAISFELFLKNGFTFEVFVDGAFHSAAVVSSTGYSTMSFTAFTSMLQLLILSAMFVGGSLGSTAGGLKVFRLQTMIELLRTKLRSYNLPETAINDVKIDGEILGRETIRTIAALFFAWIIVIFFSTLLTLSLEPVGLMGALSGSVSAASNMGPVLFQEHSLYQINPTTKIVWSVVMLMGRLEMLPVLAIFNRELFKF